MSRTPLAHCRSRCRNGFGADPGGRGETGLDHAGHGRRAGGQRRRFPPPKHAKPEGDSAPPKHAKPESPATDATEAGATPSKKPKHDKLALNVVRDSVNASLPKDAKPGAGDTGKDKTDDTAGGATTAATPKASEGNAA